MAPVARLVFGQERREGDLRFAHLRLRWGCLPQGVCGRCAARAALLAPRCPICCSGAYLVCVAHGALHQTMQAAALTSCGLAARVLLLQGVRC